VVAILVAYAVARMRAYEGSDLYMDFDDDEASPWDTTTSDNSDESPTADAAAPDESAPRESVPTTIDATAWILESWADDSPVPTNPGISLEIQGVLAVGKVCNSYRGPVDIDDSTFKLTGPVASTLMACLGPLGDAEPVYHALLASVDSYALVEGKLELKSAGQTVLTFKPA
jgi:heat shock protein HslJ